MREREREMISKFQCNAMYIGSHLDEKTHRKGVANLVEAGGDIRRVKVSLEYIMIGRQTHGPKRVREYTGKGKMFHISNYGAGLIVFQ